MSLGVLMRDFLLIFRMWACRCLIHPELNLAVVHDDDGVLLPESTARDDV